MQPQPSPPHSLRAAAPKAIRFPPMVKGYFKTLSMQFKNPLYIEICTDKKKALCEGKAGIFFVVNGFLRQGWP
jgi:hypothetical protein